MVKPTDEQKQSARDYFGDITLEMAFGYQQFDQGDLEDAAETIQRAIDRASDMQMWIGQLAEEARP